jgi:5'-deoxynucleotidase YfbR-like HD superfamily hydrolase
MRALEFMWRGGETRRYHGFRMLMEDTVGHHSYNVACVIMFLRPDASARLLRAALKHDMAEHLVGDMPAPTKRNLPNYESRPIPGDGPASFREVFAAYEDDVMRSVGVEPENLLDGEAWVLKLADSMDGMRFCIQERQLGNRTRGLEEVYRAFRSYVCELLYGEVLQPLDELFAEKINAHATTQDVKLFRYLCQEWETAK